MKISRLAVPANSSGATHHRALAPPILRAAIRICAAFALLSAAASALTLEWDRNPESDIARYQVSYGTVSGTYPVTIDAGTNVSVPITGLTEGATYYFIVTAVNLTGIPSEPSAEVSYLVPVTTPGSTNQAPVASAISTATQEDNPVSIVLSGSDADLDPLTYSIVAGPSKGSLTGTAPNLTYTPSADFNGGDSFTYKVNDGKIGSNIATVAITINPVNDAPAATAKAVTTAEDAPISIILAGTDKEGTALTYTVVSGPTKGSLSGTAPNLTYTPTADYNGGDSFTFKANDGTVDSNTATVSITVSPVNDAPVATPKSLSTQEDTPLAITFFASDKENNPLSYKIVSRPGKGTLSGTAPNLTYTPSADVNGSDSFAYKVNDGTVDSNTATVSITITPVNDAPVATPKSLATATDKALALTLTGSDKEGGPLTYAIVTGPSNGVLSGTAPNIIYTPVTAFTGTDSFTFRTHDGTDFSNIATVSIAVNETVVPDNSRVIPRSGWTLRYVDSEQPGDNPARFAFDGDPATFWHTRWRSGGTPPPHEIQIDLGSVRSLEGFRYLPRQDGFLIGNIGQYEFHTSLDGNTWSTPAASGSFANDSTQKEVSFSARNARYVRLKCLTEANGATHASIAELDILGGTAVNTTPIAASGTASTVESEPVSIVLHGSDGEEDPLNYSIVDAPANGTLSGTAPNLIYTPAPGFTGADSFTYQVDDGLLTSTAASISITVTAKPTEPSNRPPVFKFNPIQRAAGIEEKRYTADAIADTAADPDQGDTLAFIKVSGPAWLRISSDGDLSGIPPAGSEGIHRFTVRATDPDGASDETQLVIEVSAPGLPLPWDTQSLGRGGSKTKASYRAGVFTLESAGDLAGATDAGGFVWQTMSGDGEIIARVSDLEDGDKSSRAGLMIRDSLAANSKHVFIGVDGSGDFRWVRRIRAGGDSVTKPGRAGSFPNAWLRLVRKGDTTTAFKSANGSDWTQVGSATTNFGLNCYIGLSVSSGKNTTTTAIFRSVKLKP